MPQDSPKTGVAWLVYLVEKLGFPTVLIGVAWFRLLEPAIDRHFADRDAERQQWNAIVAIQQAQTRLMEESNKLSAAADREQLEILKRIERNGM